MTPPPWHITHSACQRLAHLMRWTGLSEDDLITRGTQQLLDVAGHATYRERDRYGRELWKSPRRTGGGMRWVVDTRVDRTRGELPQVVWVGHGPPPARVWAP